MQICRSALWNWICEDSPHRDDAVTGLVVVAQSGAQISRTADGAKRHALHAEEKQTQKLKQSHKQMIYDE